VVNWSQYKAERAQALSAPLYVHPATADHGRWIVTFAIGGKIIQRDYDTLHGKIILILVILGEP
jgi:hypothetical protein